MTAVDARFAGGAILVDHESSVLDDGTRMVEVDAPGWDVTLFPHEARALAAALTAAATKAERLTARLRRHTDVDEHLRRIDG